MQFKPSFVFVLGAVLLSLYWVLFSHFHFLQFGSASEAAILESHQLSQKLYEQNKHLVDIILQQNATIYKLAQRLEESKQAPPSAFSSVHSLLDLAPPKPEDLALPDLQPVNGGQAPESTVSPSFDPYATFGLEPQPVEASCDAKLGLGLLEAWKGAGELWCGGGTSKIVCYPYKQEHRDRKDVFCEAFDVFVDFSKVQGGHASNKPSPGNQYLTFSQGVMEAACQRTKQYDDNLIMNHMKPFFKASRTVSEQKVREELGRLREETTPTYLLARDEDCENMFHSTADHTNMVAVYAMLGLKPSATQVVLFDRFFDGPYYDLIQKSFSQGRKLKRYEDYNGQKVRFKHLIFHLESPAAHTFPKVGQGAVDCRQTAVFDLYRRHVLNSFGLLHVPPPKIPAITLSLRKRTAAKNVGRVLENEAEVVSVLRKGGMVDVNVVDMATLSFEEQLKLMRRTNILVGVHGAGLMHTIFLAEEAVLVEIHPSYRLDRHFRHASKLAGKTYMPIRSTTPVTCHGTSDNVKVDVGEFERTIDGAVRMARSFGKGLAECGLVCQSSVLALDTIYDSEYGRKNEKKGARLNTRFPCG